MKYKELQILNISFSMRRHLLIGYNLNYVLIRFFKKYIHKKYGRIMIVIMKWERERKKRERKERRGDKCNLHRAKDSK